MEYLFNLTCSFLLPKRQNNVVTTINFGTAILSVREILL